MQLEKLDTDLKNYKSNSIKESIRYFKVQNLLAMLSSHVQ